MLRNQLILMRIRILDPHWKKMNPDPGYFFKIYWFFLHSKIFKFVLFFLLIFMLNLDEPFRNRKISIISLFSIFQVWVLRVNFAVLIDNLDNWIRIFFRIRIQEAKILRIQRIRFLCTGRENNGNCQNSTLFLQKKTTISF